MLIILLTTLFFGSGAEGPFGKQERRAVRAVVEDEASREAVLASLKEVNGLAKRLAREAGDTLDALAATAEDRDAGREEYVALLDELAAVRAEAYARYTDVVFEMRGRMTREQWQAVFAAPGKDATEAAGDGSARSSWPGESSDPAIKSVIPAG